MCLLWHCDRLASIAQTRLAKVRLVKVLRTWSPCFEDSRMSCGCQGCRNTGMLLPYFVTYAHGVDCVLVQRTRVC